MVGGAKPSGHKVKLQDVVRPPDIKIVKPVNSSSDIDSLLIGDLGEYLHILNIGQYAEQLADAQIDGILLKEFTGLTILMSGGRTTSCNLTL